MPKNCARIIFEMLDTNDNNQIEFSEFKAAMIRATLHIHDHHLHKAFRFFDRDNSGFISKQELRSVFETFGDLFNMFNNGDYDMVIS